MLWVFGFIFLAAILSFAALLALHSRKLRAKLIQIERWRRVTAASIGFFVAVCLGALALLLVPKPSNHTAEPPPLAQLFDQFPLQMAGVGLAMLGFIVTETLSAITIIQATIPAPPRDDRNPDE